MMELNLLKHMKLSGRDSLIKMVRQAIERPKKILICPACGRSDFTKTNIESLIKCKICNEEYTILDIILNSWKNKE